MEPVKVGLHVRWPDGRVAYCDLSMPQEQADALHRAFQEAGKIEDQGFRPQFKIDLGVSRGEKK